MRHTMLHAADAAIRCRHAIFDAFHDAAADYICR